LSFDGQRQEPRCALPPLIYVIHADFLNRLKWVGGTGSWGRLVPP
jgi:hypothetical protein